MAQQPQVGDIVQSVRGGIRWRVLEVAERYPPRIDYWLCTEDPEHCDCRTVPEQHGSDPGCDVIYSTYFDKGQWIIVESVAIMAGRPDGWF